MATSKNELVVPNSAKEALALETMLLMLQGYMRDTNCTFDEAFTEFASSATYETLFDLDTEVWKEGPVYLRCLFNREDRSQPY